MITNIPGVKYILTEVAQDLGDESLRAAIFGDGFHPRTEEVLGRADEIARAYETTPGVVFDIALFVGECVGNRQFNIVSVAES